MKINIKRMIDTIPENVESNEEILRYVYQKIGNIFTYNRDYLYVPDFRFSKDMYEYFLTIRMIDEAEYESKIKTICKQIAEIFVEVINKIPEEKKKDKLSAKMVGYRKGKENHVATLVKSGDKNYYMDLYRDIYAIQKGFRTKYFALSKEKLEEELKKYPDIRRDLGNIKCDKIDKKKIEEIDKKFGFSFNGIYMDDAIEALRKEMNIEDNWRKYTKDYDEITKKENKEDVIARLKIDFIFNHFKNNAQEEKMGIFELTKFYKRLYQTLLTEEEKKKNNLIRYDVKLANKDNELEDSIIYEIKRNKNCTYFIYENSEGQFRKITPDELQKKEKEGELEYLSEYGKFEFYEMDDELII